jgi:putative transposase
METLSPHQSALRKGRVSLPGYAYAITKCVEGKEFRLVYDPYQPLLDPRPAQTIIASLRWLHKEKRIACRGYVIMPDHIHIIFVLGNVQALSGVMKSFGKYTARRLNELQGRSGSFWQSGFYDHICRDEEDYRRRLRYIYENPVRKGYVEQPEDWPYSAIELDW